MSWKVVIRDTFIVWCFTALGGLTIGFAFGLVGAVSSPKLPVALAFSNILFGIVGFTIVGVLTKTKRFRHLLVVTATAWLTSLLNVGLFGATLTQWALSLVLLVLIMLLGGALSFLLVRPTKPTGVSEPAA